MQDEKNDDLLDHINKVKALADQLACLEVHVKNENVVTTLLKNFPSSYAYLITTLNMMPVIEMIMKYVTTCLMHEMSKKKEREPKRDDVTMILRQDKADKSILA